MHIHKAAALLLAFLGTLGAAATTHAQNASPFEACPQDTSLINNATVYVPGALSTANGDSLQTGDEIALFTDDGTCTGVGVWNDAPLAITVYGADPWSNFQGYEKQETLQFKVWDASRQTTYTTKGSYASCPEDSLSGCQDNGRYSTNALYTLSGFSRKLPVEIANFEAMLEDQQMVFTWKTTSETNNKGFRIERKKEGADQWTRVAFVESQAEGGTSTRPISYTHRADKLGYGRHVFRLVQRDQSGTTTPVGEQQQVKIALSKPYTLSAAHPNPFRQRATVELTVREAQKVTVAVYDMLGRRVKHLYEGTLAPNTPREFTFDGASHASGLYFLRIKGKSFQATRKATLVK
jgi:hypothetical protein